MFRRDGFAPFEFRPRRSVRWMSPVTWLTTARAIWRGRRFRTDDVGLSRSSTPLEPLIPDAHGDVWVDFVSDTGDGFPAMATIGWLLARDSIELPGVDVTARGRLLVHGGDMVYPSGTEAAYRDRFAGPMSAMLPETDVPLRLAAIPGNHDLHDGSVAWRQIITTGGWIGAWRTEQTDTWFAVSLSDLWWLWAVDAASGGELGAAELEYFESIAQSLKPGSQVIVVVSEPAWVQADDETRRSTYRFVSENLVADHGGRVRLWLSGDSHHYNRFVDDSADEPTHFVTAGGGGAFLSATHSIPNRTEFGSADLRLVPASVYPDPSTSRRLVWTAPSLLWRNGAFPLVAGGVYGIAGWIRGSADLWSAAETTAASIAFTLALLAGAWLYSANRTWRSVVVAVGHAAFHLSIIGALGFVAQSGRAGTAILFAAMGAVIGPVVIGLALIGANLLGLNDNELFSAIRVSDYRCFVRLRVDRDQVLTMYPIGVDRVVRTWRVDDEAPTPVLQPIRPIRVRSIERPVVIVPAVGG